MFVKALNLALFASVYAESALDDEDTFLLQAKVQQGSPALTPPDGLECFANTDPKVWGGGWHCGLPEAKKWCGSNHWDYGRVVRKCCPDLCKKAKKGGCGFDTSQCKAAGCGGGTACCLQKGTTKVTKKYKGKDVTRENRKKCFQKGDYCSQGGKKYCGKDGFESPDDKRCTCNVGENSNMTPKEAMAEINAAKEQQEKDTKKEGTLSEGTAKKETATNEARRKRKEAGRKEWQTKNPKHVRRKWQEKNEKKPSTTPAPHKTTAAPPKTTAAPPKTTAAPPSPAVPPSPPSPSPSKNYDLCRDVKCKKGKSCCVRNKKKLWDVGGKDITVQNRDKCLKQNKANKWCTQGNFVYEGN